VPPTSAGHGSLVGFSSEREKLARWTLGRKLALGFSLCVVLLLGVGVTGYRAVGGLTQTSLSVAHTHEVLEHIARVQSLLKDAETGQRGFVVTGDEAFLEPYHAASESLAATIQALRKLTADNAEQQARIAEAEPLVAAKMGELLETIELRRASGFEPTRDVVAAGGGKRVMDDIRRVLGHMEVEERELLVRRADEVDATTSNTRTTIVATTLLCLLLVAAAGISITRGASIQVGGSVRDMQSS
jgi:CHASE3 domain sensor protein